MESVIVLTGASRGIGRAAALQLARPGRRLALLARGRDGLEQVAAGVRDAGGVASVHPVDLRDGEAVTRVVSELAQGPAPDAVVLNAGRSNSLPVTALPGRLDVVHSTLGTNYTGHVQLFLGLLRAMAARGTGVLVGVTSANARLPAPGWSAYSASKAAFDAWLRAVGPELRPLGIATTVLSYPLVDTDMIRPVYGRSRWAMSPERAGSWIVKAIERHPARIAPWWLPPVEVLTAVVPATTARLMARWSIR